jgi:hypothetical protein
MGIEVMLIHLPDDWLNEIKKHLTLF